MMLNLKRSVTVFIALVPLLLQAQSLAVFQCPTEAQVASYLQDDRAPLASHARIIAKDRFKNIEILWVKQYECQCSRMYQQQQSLTGLVRFNYAELSSGWMGARMYNKHYPKRPSDSGLSCHYQASGGDLVMIINQIGFPQENFYDDFKSLDDLYFSYFMPDSTYTQHSFWQKNSYQQKYLCDRQGFQQQGCVLTLKTTENHDDWLLQVSSM
ncbi:MULTISPECIES: hypothetical protein [Cysteiniphilum]|nr:MULTISPECIES: hypothetical protein [Cysteiniphilum]